MYMCVGCERGREGGRKGGRETERERAYERELLVAGDSWCR